MLSFECIKNEKSVYFLLTSALRRVCCSTLHLVSSIDYSFVVSALALRYKGFTKFYNWNMQRILQRLKIKWIVTFDGLNIWI